MKNETKQSQHTPGPWRIDPVNSQWHQYVKGADHTVVCVGTCRTSRNQSTVAADARLIAAAPDLLEAAKNVLQWLEIALPKFDGPLDVGNGTHQIALRAAIAKAEKC